MDLDLFGASTRLARNATARLQGRRGARIECLVGSLWVTQDGDPRDIVLAPGDAFVFDRDGVALASAIGDAEGGARYLLLDERAATAAVA